MEAHSGYQVQTPRSTNVHQQNWTEGAGYLFSLQDSSVPLKLTLGSFFLLCHLRLLLVWLLHLMSFLFCMFYFALDLTSWVVFQDDLCWHAGEWLAEDTGDGQAVIYFPQMSGFSVLPPSLKHQGQNDFSPTLADTMEHQKASLECSPWRPTMALVIPLS